MLNSQILWQPSEQFINNSQVKQFINALNSELQLQINDFHQLYEFSISQPENFWQSFLKFSNIKLQHRGQKILDQKQDFMHSRWFADSTLNFAENLLINAKMQPEKPALIFCCEDRLKRKLSYSELFNQVNNLRKKFKELGLKPGQRVAAITANCPESIIAMLATTAEGAIWSSCSPDFGSTGILDRFQQIEPSILIAVEGYFYKGQYIALGERIEEVCNNLPSLKAVITYALEEESLELNTSGIPQLKLSEIIFSSHNTNELTFAAFPFNHPLYIMFSSGTTGKPKCIVHGAGGSLLEHLKEFKLHCDLKSEEKIFYNTTCGWMMWNWLVSSLAVGSTVVLYDGFPLLNNGHILFDLVADEKINIFGSSAGYISAINKAGLIPKDSHNLEHLRLILSTGSVLAPELFDYVYNSIKKDVQLSSISGGTDIIGCFALGSPMLPVRRGQLQCRSLGYSVNIFNEQGQPVKNKPGELVCTKPFPSMPLFFWNDSDNQKYKSAYFSKYPNIWCHGDFAELTDEQGIIIYGRSDATLNPGGVRIGTAEIYRQLENFLEIQLALVTGLTVSADEQVILFLKLSEGTQLNSELIDKIKNTIRAKASPRHVPFKILQVSDIPITRSGKVSELCIKRIINGQAIDNSEALQNPECLDEYRMLKL